MDPQEELAALEAVLFCSGDPVMVDKLCAIFAITPLQLSHWLDQLDQVLQGRGIKIARGEDSVQLEADPAYTPYVEKLAAGLRPARLSSPTLETLAIIAYRQPITRPEIEEIRGVKVERALNTLLSYDLITEVGRRETTGRPILYGTTDEFLRHFGLNNLSQLPTVREGTAPGEKPGAKGNGGSK